MSDQIASPTAAITDARARSVLRAARLYYLQDHTMESIAVEMGVSRSSISRMLTEARATGIVEIRLHEPASGADELAEELSTRLGISVHVVPVPRMISDVDRLERVARTAARMLGTFIDSNLTLGIAWGSTTQAISRHLTQQGTHNVTIVQMNGSGNVRTSGIEYASEILQRFGAAFGAEVQQFPVPAFFDDPATKQALWRERATRRLLDIQARMDVALFGLGSPFSEIPSQVYVGGYLDEADYRALDADGAVGDVATVFYRMDGSHRGIRLNSRASGPEFGRLRRVARRIGVVSGVQKLNSTRGALAAGLVTDLILDEDLARALTAI